MEGRSLKLKLSEGVVYAERGGKHLFLQPSIPDWLVVNQNGAILLTRCNGSATREDIVKSTAAFGSLSQQAQALFSEALSRGILVDSAFTLNNDAKTVRSAEPRSNKPILGSVHLTLTNQCNLHCSYCYAQSGKPSQVALPKIWS